MKLITLLLLCGFPLFSFGQPESKPFKLFFEKVYLHTDKGHYIAGEDIWFKAYLMDGNTNRLTSTSEVLYVELINGKHEIIQRRKVWIKNGTGNGDFILPDSLDEGLYKIRAYTNWQRNFGDNFFFTKDIYIYSNKVISGLSELNINPIKKTAIKNGLPLYTSSPPILNILDYHLNFFPEGGSMLSGALGVVAFKATDNKELGIDFKGSVFTSDGIKVLDFESQHLGMGIFTITPKLGKTYKVKGQFANGKTFDQELPKAKQTGFNLHIRNAGNYLRILITTNQETFNLYQQQKLKLIGRSKGKITFNTYVTLSNKTISSEIDRSHFPEGITALTLYGPDDKPYCERLIFIDNDQRPQIITKVKTVIVGNKKRVTVDIMNKDTIGIKKIELSMAVTNASTIPKSMNHIVSDILIQSEIKGTIENAETYFDSTNVLRKQQLDLLLLTQGWRDFLWKRLTESSLHIKFKPERGFEIAGQVRTIARKNSFIQSNISFFAPKAIGNRLFSTRTDSTGKFHFDNVRTYGTQIITIKSANNKGEDWGRITAKQEMETPPPFSASSVIGIGSATSRVKEELIEEYSKRFKLGDTIQIKEVNVKIKTNKQVRLTDQIATSFGYPVEKFDIEPADSTYFDLLHYLKTKLRNSAPLFMQGITSKGEEILSLPRIFVNGKEMIFSMETEDDIIAALHYYDIYLGMTMDKIKNIEVQHLLGKTAPKWIKLNSSDSDFPLIQFKPIPQRVDGPSDIYLIYITLKPGALDYQNYSETMVELNGYDKERIFYTSAIKGAEAGSYNTTLCWQPNLTLSGSKTLTQTFDASLDKPIQIEIEGVTDTGFPIFYRYNEKSLAVKAQSPK